MIVGQGEGFFSSVSTHTPTPGLCEGIGLATCPLIESLVLVDLHLRFGGVFRPPAWRDRMRCIYTWNLFVLYFGG